MLDVADMSAREVDNDEVVCIDYFVETKTFDVMCGGRRSGRRRVMTTMEQMILSLLLLL